MKTGFSASLLMLRRIMAASPSSSALPSEGASAVLGQPQTQQTLAFRPRNVGSSDPPVSKSQSLINLLTRQLDSQADNITLSRSEALGIVQQLRSSGGSEAYESVCGELAKEKERVKAFRAHCRLGDYAGIVFNDLKGSWIDVDDKGTPQMANTLSEELREEQAGKYGSQALSLKQTVSAWTSTQLSEDQRVDMASLAVHAYGARNTICHSQASRLKTGGNWHGLGQQISKDLRELKELLPVDQLKHQEIWRQILEYYRDRYIEFDPKRQKWVPSEEAVAEAVRPIDPRPLPLHLRRIPFDEYQFWDPIRVEPHAKQRGTGEAQRSDPPVGAKGQRQLDDEELEQFIEYSGCLPPAKRFRLMSEATGNPRADITDPEYDKLYINLEENLRAGREADLKDAKSFLQRIVDDSRTELLGRGVLGPMDERKKSWKALKAERKQEKLNRREQRRSAVEESGKSG